jgi:hypothetical protein
MLRKLDERFRSSIPSIPESTLVGNASENDPLTEHLKSFQEQHRTIILLYKGVIISFGTLLVTMSFLIYSAMEQMLIPFWTALLLSVVDIFFFGALVVAIIKLDNYRKRGDQLQKLIMGNLKSDIHRLKQIKIKQNGIMQSHRHISERLKILAGRGMILKVPDYKGWDQRVCTSCGTVLEMEREVCVSCQQKLDKLLPN